jgi:hypothetical protein
MNIPRHYLKILTIAILIGLVVFSVLALILRVFLAEFDPTSYITAIALLAIAVLTVVYVLTSSGQLDCLGKQLADMQQTRKVGSQPLPVLTISQILIEPPRLFYSPSEDMHSFSARLRAEFSLKNHTAFPAINVIASAAVVLNNGNKPVIIPSAPTQVDILAENEIFPPEDSRNPDFIFNTNKDNEILARLQKKTSEFLPVLGINLIYTNILGACFAVDAAFRLVPIKQEDEDVLKDWHSNIVSFPIEYKDKLKEMDGLKKDKKDMEWQKLFNLVEKKAATATGKDDLEISWERLPNSFQIRVISQEEYKEKLIHMGVEKSE